MANSASDARSSEQELRQKLIGAKAVDVMVAVGPNMFYTVTLPCTLWFFDWGKAKTPRVDTVLFIDARHIYRQIDRAHREWTPAQIGFPASLVRLYRNEVPDFILGGDEPRRYVGVAPGETVSDENFKEQLETLNAAKIRKLKQWRERRGSNPPPSA